MKSFFLAVLLFAIPSAYCQQIIHDTIMHGNLNRSFILYIPGSYTPEIAAPLVINFHGYKSNAFEQMNYGDFWPIADTAGFILLRPMGTSNGLGNPFWNSNWGGTVDDIAFTQPGNEKHDCPME